ncbi:MAG: radical SAM/SPASM domain-containing protein [Promethearchaeota archaeon]
MSVFKNLLNKFYHDYVFKYYYILYQKSNWNLKKLIIKPFVEFARLNYRKFNPSVYLFHSIQIQTQSYCNLNCQFCPNNKINREHGKMPLDLFNKIINELSELNYTGEIMLYLQNEPLLDKRMINLINITHKKCPNAIIGLYSNGTILTNDLLCKLFDAGLTFLRINDYSMVQLNETKNEEAYEVKSRVKDFKCYLANRKRINLYRFFPSIIKMSSRSGLMEGVGIPTPLNLFCNRPFEQMYINFKGDALFCCNDWLFSEIMGNIKNTSLFEIWTNKKYTLLRRELYRNSRKRICYECDYASVLFPKIVFTNIFHKLTPF